jgi:hypothetical protein
MNVLTESQKKDMYGLALCGSWQCPVAGFRKYGSSHPGSIESGGYLSSQNKYLFLK